MSQNGHSFAVGQRVVLLKQESVIARGYRERFGYDGPYTVTSVLPPNDHCTCHGRFTHENHCLILRTRQDIELDHRQVVSAELLAPVRQT